MIIRKAPAHLFCDPRFDFCLKHVQELNQSITSRDSTFFLFLYSFTPCVSIQTLRPRVCIQDVNLLIQSLLTQTRISAFIYINIGRLFVYYHVDNLLISVQDVNLLIQTRFFTLKKSAAIMGRSGNLSEAIIL